MNVIVPYVRLLEWQQLCLQAEGIRAYYVKMRNDYHYWQLLKELWEAKETFILLEHDIVPWPGAIRQLWDCPEYYCALPYQLSGCIGLGMGCNKFSAELLREVAFVESCAWHMLHGQLKHALPHPHMHLPAALHFNHERLVQ